MAEPSQNEEDIFEAVHHAEASSIQEGFQSGMLDGMVAGLTEGRELGLLKGYEIGMEVGFYTGCTRTWRALHALQGAPPPAAAGSLAKAIQHPAFVLHPPGSQQLTSIQRPTADRLTSHQGSSVYASVQPAAAQTTREQLQGQPGPVLHAQLPTQDDSSPPGFSNKQLPKVPGAPLPERTDKALQGLEQLLANFPLADPQDEQLHELLGRLRGRFKAVASMMGLLQDYMPREGELPHEAGAQPASAGAARPADLAF